jgi:hypothetical protein
MVPYSAYYIAYIAVCTTILVVYRLLFYQSCKPKATTWNIVHGFSSTVAAAGCPPSSPSWS